MSGACPHAAGLKDVEPQGNACQDCLKIGDQWLSLRVCMTCGYVGCCDSSPNRHASRHFQATGHPVVRSGEPGERWAWCYLDSTFLSLEPHLAAQR